MASDRPRWPGDGRAWTGAAILVALVAGVGACAWREPQARQVVVRAFRYQPDTLAVAQGDTVVWSNDDFVPHTATARDGTWDSQLLAPGKSWRLVAKRPGRHDYYCVYHPNMRATIDVR